ncbi:hypothetical protein [Tropicibacter oceani]|uniref:LysM domain-containing protein n=1 Tax=Tropicibacter oceani TaxID=3058420 RepID=A0ABY8QLN3_9RHOB|nr:hypothetical protein [Tropicibacter oceani]WGW05469.1 hypothetical protein QF118_07955 [Tropicibacter oceani]
MVTRLSAAFRRRPILTGAFALALALTLFFAIRLALHSLYWTDPAHRDQQIMEWMTPGYVAHSWSVPRALVGDTLGFAKGAFEPGQTLEELAEQRGVPVAQLIEDLNAAIADFRANPHD